MQIQWVVEWVPGKVSVHSPVSCCDSMTLCTSCESGSREGHGDAQVWSTSSKKTDDGAGGVQPIEGEAPGSPHCGIPVFKGGLQES